MVKNSIFAFNNKESVPDVLSELLRDGAQQLIHQAVESELSEYLSQHQRLTDDGRIPVVRNGYLPKREILTGIVPVRVQIPKIRSRAGEPLTFRSALVSPYVRKTRSLEAALPWLYLKGVSTGEMGEALKVLVGHDDQGLSARTVSRLKSE
jgi:putative transposase